jgi:hypothetical protein
MSPLRGFCCWGLRSQGLRPRLSYFATARLGVESTEGWRE